MMNEPRSIDISHISIASMPDGGNVVAGRVTMMFDGTDGRAIGNEVSVKAYAQLSAGDTVEDIENKILSVAFAQLQAVVGFGPAALAAIFASSKKTRMVMAAAD